MLGAAVIVSIIIVIVMVCQDRACASQARYRGKCPQPDFFDPVRIHTIHIPSAKDFRTCSQRREVGCNNFVSHACEHSRYKYRANPRKLRCVFHNSRPPEFPSVNKSHPPARGRVTKPDYSPSRSEGRQCRSSLRDVSVNRKKYRLPRCVG